MELLGLINMFIILIFILFVVGSFAQTPQSTRVIPPCVVPFTFTAASSGTVFFPSVAGFDNRQQQCTNWNITYSNFNFSAVSLVVQSAPMGTNTTAGTFVTFAGTIPTGGGINPNTATDQAQTTFSGYFPFVRVTATLTGTGRLTGVLIGTLPLAANGGSGGGGGGCPGGSNGQVQYDNSGACGGMSGTSWNDTNRYFSSLDASNNFIVEWAANLAGNLSHNGVLFGVNSDNVSQPTVGSGNGTNGGIIAIITPGGGATTDLVASGGAGGDFSSGTGNGGSGLNGGGGGNFGFNSGNGGAGAGTGAIGGDGGAFSIQAGVGGDAIGTGSVGGNGGNIAITPGQGGSGVMANGAAGKFIINGAFASEDGTCTAATLTAILTADRDKCFCTDCTITSSIDNTCAGSGTGAGVWRINGVNKCFI